MKKTLLVVALFSSLAMQATITDVTSTYLTNPDFAARYAGWYNQAGTKGVTGGFVHQTNDAFVKKHAEVYMERNVSVGSKIPNCDMYQYLKGLPSGTYTLVCAAFCGNGSGGSYTPSSGGYLYAQDQQTPINGPAGDYSVVFSVGDDGKATVGIKSQNAACNWMAFDNFRLYYNTEGSADSLAARQAIIDAERLSRQAIQDAARSAAKVTTYPYVGAGVTIALMRATFTANGTSAKEYGVCWSKDSKEPTIMDDCTTEYFSNKGYLFRIEGLTHSTGYWARPYVITNDNRVAYGEVIKFYTERKGNTTYEYNYYAQVEDPSQISWDYNINSGMAETVWMYNQLAYISGLHLNVHYARGAGAGGGTAECSYGGWMNVSQNWAYQQTGTMLHETNHGVGVGQTNEWYNNSNLRENTGSGKWLGPRTTKMVRLLENNEEAFLTGDGVHMWASTTSGSLTYGYGINGAQEDSYSPSNHLLYYGNILVTHALHQDGMPATWSSGITAAYTFTQDDDEIYYIKAENGKYGLNDRFVGVSVSGATSKFGNVLSNFSDIAEDPNYQWKITYAPTLGMYAFQNKGTGEYLYSSSSTVKLSGTTPATNNYFMLLPARKDVSSGDFTATGYWVVRGNTYDSYAVKTVASTAEVATLSGSTFDPNNETGASQRFLLLTSSEAQKAQEAARNMKMARLEEILSGCDAIVDVPVEENVAGAITDFETIIAKVKKEKDSYETAADVTAAVSMLLSAVNTYLTNCQLTDPSQPADLSFMWQNMSLASGTDYWTASVIPVFNYGCYEFYEKTFDFYQVSEYKMPIGNYRLIGQAFQRPGSYTAVYNDYIKNGTDNVNAKLYITSSAKTTNNKVSNIWRDCTTSSLGDGSVSVGGKYIPNTMESAAAWFNNGLYNDTLFHKATGNSTMRLGLSGTTGTSYWFMFKGGFRVLYYGSFEEDEIIDGTEDQNGKIGCLRYGKFHLSGTDAHTANFTKSFETRKTPNLVLSAPTVRNKSGKFLNIQANNVSKFTAAMKPYVKNSEGDLYDLTNMESAAYMALPKDTTVYALPSTTDATKYLTLQCGATPTKIAGENVHVTFEVPYKEGVKPVVIVSAVKASSIAYGMLPRVENITNTGFDVRIERPEYYSSKAFTAVQVYYFAMEPGDASLGGGLLISAQRYEDALIPSILSGETIYLDTPLLNPYIILGAQSIKHDALREVFIGRTETSVTSDGLLRTTAITPYAYLDETATTSGTAYSPSEDLGLIAVAVNPNGNPEDEPTITGIHDVISGGNSQDASFDAWTEDNIIRSNSTTVHVYTTAGLEVQLNKPLPMGLYIISDGKTSKKINIR